MNDRHRTIERYRKKHCNKQEYLSLDFRDFRREISLAAERIREVLEPVVGNIIKELARMAENYSKVMKQFQDNIKNMSEEEFQKILESPELTPEQISCIKKIRDDNNEQSTKSMGE